MKAARFERPIAGIQIGHRHRRELGNVDQLAASIASVGLLHPIVVTPDGALIAGERRLEAAKRLGWASVPVTVVALDEIVRGEFAENANRKDFLPSEIDAIRRALEPLERAAAKKRMSEGGKVGKISTPSGKTRDKIGAIAGISGRQVEKIAEVVTAAEKEPQQFGHLMEMLDRPHGVSKAYHALRRARDEQRVLNLAPTAGKFRTLVVDPPWAYDEDLLGRGGVPYATMPRDQVLALPVPAWAEDECHLYLWTTNAMVPLAVECMAVWGFQHKSMLTWAKPSWGMAAQFRGQTEHVLFGIRGTLRTRCTNISTLLEAPTGAHSEKPEKFYEIVRAASYPPYGEAFQRKARPDFINMYEQQIASEAAQ
ncbi:MAG TPA: MT-A70 family methyltransferase [Pseudolabrys sp.]